MFCSDCGTRNEEGTAYCVSCGAELRKIQTPSVEVPPLSTGGAGPSAGPAVGYGAVYGAQVNGKVAGGNYVGARDSSRLARVWTWITLAFVILGLLILAVFVLLFILALAAGGASA